MVEHDPAARVRIAQPTRDDPMGRSADQRRESDRPEATLAERDRRRSARVFASRRLALLRSQHLCEQVQLLDESDKGVGLFLRSVEQLDVGSSVDITIPTESIQPGRVRYILPAKLGGYRVGIEWTEAADRSGTDSP